MSEGLFHKQIVTNCDGGTAVWESIGNNQVMTQVQLGTSPAPPGCLSPPLLCPLCLFPCCCMPCCPASEFALAPHRCLFASGFPSPHSVPALFHLAVSCCILLGLCLTQGLCPQTRAHLFGLLPWGRWAGAGRTAAVDGPCGRVGDRRVNIVVIRIIAGSSRGGAHWIAMLGALLAVCLFQWLAGTSDPERACVVAQGRCTFASPTCAVFG